MTHSIKKFLIWKSPNLTLMWAFSVMFIKISKRFPEINASISFCKFGIHSKIYRCLQLWIFGNFCKIFHYAPNWLFRTTNCKVSALEWTAQCYRMNNLRHLEFSCLIIFTTETIQNVLKNYQMKILEDKNSLNWQK